jgi:hypothetical protein
MEWKSRTCQKTAEPNQDANRNGFSILSTHSSLSASEKTCFAFAELTTKTEKEIAAIIEEKLHFVGLEEVVFGGACFFPGLFRKDTVKFCGDDQFLPGPKQATRVF